MAAPLEGVCTPYATEADLCSPCNDYAVLGPIAADMLQPASDVLFELLGRQFPGLCEATVRPPSACHPMSRGQSHPGVPGALPGWCYCGHSIELGAYPIESVSQVKIDGVVLDPSLYRVDDWRTLVRLVGPDGTNPGWPTSQDMDRPDSAEGTWSVSFTWGRETPPMVVRAAAVLACELALACDPENAELCRLPKKVTSITREGVTMILAPSDFLTDGKTGLYEVDLAISTYNPAKVRQRAQVWHAGMAGHAVRPGT